MEKVLPWCTCHLCPLRYGANIFAAKLSKSRSFRLGGVLCNAHRIARPSHWKRLRHITATQNENNQQVVRLGDGFATTSSPKPKQYSWHHQSNVPSLCVADCELEAPTSAALSRFGQTKPFWCSLVLGDTSSNLTWLCPFSPAKTWSQNMICVAEAGFDLCRLL